MIRRELVCDGCQKHGEWAGIGIRSYPPDGLRERLQSEGWTFIDTDYSKIEGEYWCPSCAPNRTKDVRVLVEITPYGDARSIKLGSDLRKIEFTKGQEPDVELLRELWNQLVRILYPEDYK